MQKPTPVSVTSRPCTCNHLEDAAENEEIPIRFDVETGEYQFVSGNMTLIIYHCPCCGGAAPKSKRRLRFMRIPALEESRLAELLREIETIDDALQELGTPDLEGTSATRQPEFPTRRPWIQHHRYILYHSLSNVADVWITERPDGKIHWQLQGKYKGLNGAGNDAMDAEGEYKRPWWRCWA